jgi:hypothetical protein
MREVLIIGGGVAGLTAATDLGRFRRGEQSHTREATMEPMKPMKPLEFKEQERWWPEALGKPNSAGGQEAVQYAYFRDARRLLLRHGGHIAAFDTGDHEIYGVSQASDPKHVQFTGSRGPVDLTQLKRL